MTHCFKTALLSTVAFATLCQSRATNEIAVYVPPQDGGRTKQEQIDDINKTSKFDLEGIKQECNTEAESNIAFEIVQMQKAKELRLLQQEEFARKDAEIEGEKIRRRIEEALSDEQQFKAV